MIDVALFVTAVFFRVDNFCKEHPIKAKTGPKCNLTASEAITLLVFSQWGRFSCEGDFCRFADTQLRDAFPDLPSTCAPIQTHALKLEFNI